MRIAGVATGPTLYFERYVMDMVGFPNIEKVLSKTKTLDLPLAGKFVYFLYRGSEIVYVGKSDSLLLRLGAHQATKVFDQVKYLEVLPEDQGSLEIALIKALRPSYNAQNVGPIKKKDEAMLARYDIEHYHIYHKIMSAPSVEEGDYGLVAYRLDGRYEFGIYDDDDHAHNDPNCPLLKLEEAMQKPMSAEVHEELLDLCECQPLAIVICPGGTYRDMHVEELKSLDEDDPIFAEIHQKVLEGWWNSLKVAKTPS